MSDPVDIFRLNKAYGATAVVRDLSLNIMAGEFFTLLGASGSGKTTTLMTVAGFVEPDSGNIEIGGRSIVSVAPEKRNLGVVFQNYALFPHMNVNQNIGFPLRMRGVDRPTIARKVDDILALVSLSGFGERRVGQLSGGQQQRVALARALVFQPPVLLMDEPLGALDRKLREEIQGELKRIQTKLGLTVIYVTHDQEEALILSDRIAVMEQGQVAQVGAPAQVYEKPDSLFVAQFLGESNILDADVVDGYPLKSRILVRPECMVMSPASAGGNAHLQGRVTSVEFLGASIRYSVSTPAGPITVRFSRVRDSKVWSRDDAVAVAWRADDARVFNMKGMAL